MLHMKDWTRHLYVRNHNEIWEQDRILISQQKALDELKEESVALYDAAIQFDQDLVPINFKGPVATPPIKDYIQVLFCIVRLNFESYIEYSGRRI